MGRPQPLHQQTSSPPAYYLPYTWYRLFRLKIRTNHITRGTATQTEVRLAWTTSSLYRNIYTRTAPVASIVKYHVPILNQTII